MYVVRRSCRVLEPYCCLSHRVQNARKTTESFQLVKNCKTDVVFCLFWFGNSVYPPERYCLSNLFFYSSSAYMYKCTRTYYIQASTLLIQLNALQSYSSISERQRTRGGRARGSRKIPLQESNTNVERVVCFGRVSARAVCALYRTCIL